MRQLIIARKDLKMSSGKLAAQCCHASLAFLTSKMRDANSMLHTIHPITKKEGYTTEVFLDKDIYEDWICGIFTKTMICEAKNRNNLMKAVSIAEELGLVEGKDFFLIKDSCLTELEPEEIDKDGVGRTLTCIGFRPLPDDIAHAISRKFHLYV